MILGGDLTGKLLVPIVDGDDGTWSAEIHGEKIEVSTPDALEELQKRIRMMGRYDVLLSPDEERELGTSSDKLERTFDRVMTEGVERWVALAEERLKGTNVAAFMMLGNDDHEELAEILRASDVVSYAEDRVFELPGGWELLSVGPSTPTPWKTPRELSETELGGVIEGLAGQVTDPTRAVYNIHNPPAETHLDQAPELDADLRPVVTSSGVQITSVGSTAVRKAIEDHQPVVGLHGHVHESPGTTKLGDSLCINPGSEYGTGLLRGAIVDLDSKRGLRAWQLIQG